jgi:hypothetical protein
VAFVTALIAAVGVFLYERYVGQQLEQEVNALSEEIKGFSDADMERVREFNGRLLLTQERLAKSVSIVSVFSALESATIQSVSIEQLSLKKEDDTSITLSTQLITDTFDSSLFQRGVYERNDVIETVAISELAIVEATDEGSTAAGIKFSAILKVPAEAVPVVVTEVVPVEDTVEIATSSTTTPIENGADVIDAVPNNADTI